MADVKAYLNDREQKLFLALLQTIDGKRRIEEFADDEEEDLLMGYCRECSILPDRILDGDTFIIKCNECGKMVDGDKRAEHELWGEWVRMNMEPDMEPGPHVNPCDDISPDTVNRTAGETDATHHP